MIIDSTHEITLRILKQTLIVLGLCLCWRFWGDFPDRFAIILIELVKRMVVVDVGNKLTLAGKLFALAADSVKNKITVY